MSEAAVAFGISPPRGILMLGVQGAGKSLSAKAVATAWQRPLLRLDAGSLYDKFIGESERNLRTGLHQAGMMGPVVLWMDEIEKGFASAARPSSDGGLSKRMFGTLKKTPRRCQSRWRKRSWPCGTGRRAAACRRIRYTKWRGAQ